MFSSFDMSKIEATLAAEHSPYPWYVRLAAYRFALPIQATIPQQLADEWTAVMQEAIEAWAIGEVVMPSFVHIDSLTDDMVRRRIAGYQRGYDKEYDRRAADSLWSDLKGEKERYVFADMPFGMQRAIVSRWNASHEDWMRENLDVHYEPDFGYHWLITEPMHRKDGTPCGLVTVKVRMFETDRMDGKPTRKVAEGWEGRGLPGGIWGHYPVQQPHQATMHLYVAKGLDYLKLD